MKHVRNFETYKIKKQIDSLIKESVLQVSDGFKVRSITDVPKSLINACVKMVKDKTGKDIRTFYSDVDIAEMAVNHILSQNLNTDNISSDLFIGTDAQPQAQPQVQAQAQPQVQAQAQPQVQAQPQDHPEPQVQSDDEDIPNTESEDEEDFEEIKSDDGDEENLPL